MNFEKSTTMSVRRIAVSFGIFLLIPILRFSLWEAIGSDTLALMFALNVSAWLLLLYDWELFALHWNRTKQNFADTVLYTVVGSVVLFFWTWLSNKYFPRTIVLPDPTVFTSDPIAIPGVLFAFSLSLGFILNMEFKCLTDHMKVHAREVAMILFTGFVFGLIYSAAFGPYRWTSLIPTYLYNVILFILLSYLYNQTHSIIPGILSFAIVYLSWMIFFAA
ncbi:MAG: hypothetical protein IJ225_06975 [Solobacterium sp.]|nr:hypothetical protein [Solobacterium sp.]